LFGIVTTLWYGRPDIIGLIFGRYKGVGNVDACYGTHPAFSSLGTGTPSNAEIENELISVAGLIP